MPIAEGAISLDEAMEFLGLEGDDSDQLETVAGFIDAATQMWQDKAGPVGATIYDEWYDGGRPTIALRHTPVLTVSVVSEAVIGSQIYTLAAETLDGTGTASAYGYTLDSETGLLTRRVSGTATRFAYGARNIHVVYTAGYNDLPADVTFAIKLLVRQMWDLKNGGSTYDGGPIPLTDVPPFVSRIFESYNQFGIA